MIGLLLPLLARVGVAPRFQRLAAWAFLILAAVALIFGGRAAVRAWFADRDAEVIENHDKDLTIEAAQRVTAADRAADASQRSRDEIFANSQADLKDKADEAARTRRSPLDAVFDGMRKDAGSRNRPHP